jgi:pimeloyl-ACP methyl ester carboxylesterase
MRVLYLHGFASSAQSSKARFFREKLGAHGVEVVTPDFNEPDFSTLTVTRMLAQVRAEIDMTPGPVALIGSSLGAFVAVNAAAREPARVDRLILLAPALDFGGNRMRDLGDRGLDDWRRTDTLQIFHYGYGRLVPVRYELYSDATKYDAFTASVEQPVLIFQGTRDTAVDPATVERWATARSNVELHLLDDDHQLLSSLDMIWTESARFLGITAP